MKKAKPRAGILLALWVLGSLAIASLPGFAYAQTLVGDDPSPSNPSVSGDPDMPGEKPPAQGGPVKWNSSGSGVYAGDSINPRGRQELSASPRADARAPWRLWLDSLVWAVRTRFGW
jgi:hypothetical protein